MKVSIRAGMRPRRGSDEHPLKWAFERGSALGFDGLEFCPDSGTGEFVGSFAPEVRQGIKDLSKQYNMPVFSLSADWAWSYANFFPTYKGWDHGLKLLAGDAELAQELGSHSILVHFATSQGPWEDCRALLREVAAVGKEYGVKFGYEANIWESRTGFGGLDSLIRMVDEVGSDYFGIYLHNAWPRAGLPLEQELEKAGPRLVKTMHSFSVVDGRVQIDWAKASEAIKKYFPDGVYTFEVNWDVAEENKKAFDEIQKKYW